MRQKKAPKLNEIANFLEAMENAADYRANPDLISDDEAEMEWQRIEDKQTWLGLGMLSDRECWFAIDHKVRSGRFWAIFNYVSRKYPAGLRISATKNAVVETFRRGR